MEKEISNKEEKVSNLDHQVLLINKKNITLTGITKVESINETSAVLFVQKEQLIISGSQMHISKLDVQKGVVELEGEIESFKYSNSKVKTNVLKKLFK